MLFLKMLFLHLDTNVIGHKQCSILSVLKEKALQNKVFIFLYQKRKSITIKQNKTTNTHKISWLTYD